MEEEAAGGSSNVNTAETDNSDGRLRRTAPFHRNLTDVGLFSLGGLCALSLAQLFDEECHLDFKRKALDKILSDLGQPDQTRDSMFGIMEGELMNESHAFVDALLVEPCLVDTRQPLMADFVSLAISDGCYDARMRMLIKHVAWLLRVTWDEIEDIEGELAETLEYNTYVMSEEEAKEKAKKSRNKKVKRYALIGLATVGGGALIGLTGGLAAPLVAAGAGAIIGGAGAAALGSAAGVAIIGSLFGVAGAGLTGYKMKRRIGAIEEFAFEPLTLIGSKLDSQRTVKQLHITIAVTGWLNSTMQDFRAPWSALAESKEQYSLRWESKYLFQLGEAFDYILQTGINMATMEALKYTVLAGIISAIAWPATLIAAAGAIDNPWHVCTQRATEAGKQLAEVLLAREQGNRPVTLIGFSLGARVVFSCLEELSKRKGAEGLVEDVILLGAPVSGDAKNWRLLTRVVAGKIVNGYARGDWLLKFLYRTASVTFKVAGLGPVKWDNRRMHNIDLSDIIDGHSDYIKNLDVIMKVVGVRTKDELRTPMQRPSNSNLSTVSDAGVTPSSSSAEMMTASSSSRELLTPSSSSRELQVEDTIQAGRDINRTVDMEIKRVEATDGQENIPEDDVSNVHVDSEHMRNDVERYGNHSREKNPNSGGNFVETGEVDLHAQTCDAENISVNARKHSDISTLDTKETDEDLLSQNNHDACGRNMNDTTILHLQPASEDQNTMLSRVQQGDTETVASGKNNVENIGNLTEKLEQSHISVQGTGSPKYSYRLKPVDTNTRYFEPGTRSPTQPESWKFVDGYYETSESCYFTDSNPCSEDES